MSDYAHTIFPYPFWATHYWSNWWPIGWNITTPSNRVISVSIETRSLQPIFENRIIFPEPEVRTVYVNKQ